MRDEVLAKVKDQRLRIYTVWEPILPKDRAEALPEAAALLAEESRGRQYWDPGAQSGKAYMKALDVPLKSALWDAYLLFPPGVTWDRDPPAPRFWMHQLSFLPFTDGAKRFGHLRLDSARLVKELENLLP
jgi:hypothetical protein